MEPESIQMHFPKARIRATAVTENLGIAGLVGTVHGWTTPSITGVEVIGGAPSDYAVRVDFERAVFDDDIGAWFAEELLEPVDDSTPSS